MLAGESNNRTDNGVVSQATDGSRLTRLFLVRHGEPAFKNGLLGRTDSRLTERGCLQLLNTCQQLPPFDLTIASPLKRCREFAEEFSRQRQRDLLVNSGLRECDFGDWDGLSYQEIIENWGDEYRGFLSDPSVITPPNGEPLSEFVMRIQSTLTDVLNDHQGKTILLLTHGGVIRSLVGWCLGLNLPGQGKVPFQRIKIDYASLTEISIFHGEEPFPQLIQLNCQFKENQQCLA